MINGALILLGVGAWAAYKLACWLGEPENGSDL